MNASKTILIYSKDLEIIDAVRSIATTLSCRIWVVDYKEDGTTDSEIAAFGHFARVFDADVYRTIAHDLQLWIDDGVVLERPTIVIGGLDDLDSKDVELFPHVQDPRLALRLHQALELWRLETGLEAGYTSADDREHESWCSDTAQWDLGRRCRKRHARGILVGAADFPLMWRASMRCTSMPAMCKHGLRRNPISLRRG